MGKKYTKKKTDYVNKDYSRENRIAERSYLVCVVLYGIASKLFLTEPSFPKMAGWFALLYYFLLVLPILLTRLDRRENIQTLSFRNVLYISSFPFYVYLICVDSVFGNLGFVLWVLLSALLYFDIRFYRILCDVVVCGQVLEVVIRHLIFGEEYFENLMVTISLAQAVVIFLITVLLFFVARQLAFLQEKRIGELVDQKKRFEALVLVRAAKIFEYDVKNDEVMLMSTNGKGEEHHRKIEHFVDTAKQYRYVLYADWHIFDRFMEECRKNRTDKEQAEENISVQMRLRNKNADYLWYQLNARTLYNEHGKAYKVVGSMENIDDMKRYELRLLDENMRDPLSKLYKRAYAKQLMAESLKEHEEGSYAGLLIIDIDNYTTLCEEMGNTFGDEVIRSMAADLESLFYTSDILGRVGGDEFVILMKNLRDPEHVDMKIHELQEVVRKTYSEKEMNFTSTVTVGASIYPVDGSDFAQLYSKAEKALAYAKEKGKDRHEFYSADREEEYAKLEVEDKHNRIREKDEMEMLNKGKDSESLAELAFRLIEESRDTDSAINLLLRQVTRKMDLDGICIRKKMEKENKVSYPYRCIMGKSLPDFGYSVELNPVQWEIEKKSFENCGGFSCCEDTTLIKEKEYQLRVNAYNVKAFARVPFYERGEYIGSIDLMDCHKSREWTEEERKTIQALANVISSYLLKMKAFEDASDTVDKLTGYDAVTGFYKYERFLSVAEGYFATAPKGKYAMVYMDFSNFKFINEAYGYEVGDKVLRDYADAARGYKEVFIAGSRVFSDNVVCLIKVIWDDENTMRERMLAAGELFVKQVQKEYLDSNLSLNIGVCMFEADDKEIPFKSIVSNANLARKEAKKAENLNCVVYNESMGEKLIREVSYVNDMENALATREFTVYFQPKIDLKNHIITGAEALIRWIRKDGTIIYPNDFIPVFEKNKTITLLDYFVYDEVCKYLANRIRNKERLVSISMNVSRIHLQTMDSMVAYVGNLIKKYGIPPHYLEFELTETVFTDKVDDTIELMNRLRSLGVKVSMDDFGSGYSSLNVLTKLPLDVLKLDKEFLKDFETDPEGKIIIPSIIDMAKKLQLSVVCEGVETKEQVEFLRRVDCDLVQGYYYSRPVPQNVFSQMLEDDDFVIHHEQGAE